MKGKRNELCYEMAQGGGHSRGAAIMRRLLLPVVCAAVMSASAGVKYEIAMMDVSNEAGPNRATIDDYVCLEGWKSYGSLKVKTPSRVTIPLGGGALWLEATFGVDCRSTVDAPATFRILAPDGRVLHQEEGAKKGKKLTARLDLAGLDASAVGAAGSPTSVIKTYVPQRSKSGIKIQEDSDENSAKKLFALLSDARVI